MRFTTTIFLTFLSIFMLSCRKEKTFRVRVYNPVTEEPYENVFVTIIERENKTSGYTTESSVFYEDFTDANDEVMITKKFHKNYDYLLQTGSPEGIDMCEIESKHEGRSSSVSLQLDNKDLDGSITYVKLNPCAGFRYEIENVNCQGPSDDFKLYFEGTETGYQSSSEGIVFKEGTGCFSDSDPTFDQVPSGDWYFRQEITKNGVKEVIYDTITLVAGQDYTYTINY